MSDDCIFCKIIGGELPSSKVYEDEHAIAFMDIAPVEKGHVLVIPKEHCDPIMDAGDDILRNLISAVRKVAAGLVAALEADGLNISQANGKCAGQLIAHVHFHLIPRYNQEEERNWLPGEYDDITEMNAYAERISSAVRELQ